MSNLAQPHVSHWSLLHELSVKYDDAYIIFSYLVISGQKAFEILPPDLKDLAFRTQVKYAAHPYLWMSKARARSTGLGMESEGLELKPEELPEIDEKAIKIYPMVSKWNPG